MLFTGWAADITPLRAAETACKLHVALLVGQQTAADYRFSMLAWLKSLKKMGKLRISINFLAFRKKLLAHPFTSGWISADRHIQGAAGAYCVSQNKSFVH